MNTEIIPSNTTIATNTGTTTNDNFTLEGDNIIFILLFISYI